MRGLRARERVRPVSLLTGLAVREYLTSPGPYVALALLLLVVSRSAGALRGALDLQHVVAYTRWVEAPLLFGLQGVGLYVGMAAAMAVAGEWERKTVVPLMAAPLDATVIVLWKVAASTAAGLFMAVSLAVYLLVLVGLAGLRESGAILWGLALAVPFLVAASAFGALIGSFSPRTRAAAVGYLAVTGVMVAIRLLWSVFLAIPQEELAVPLEWVTHGLRVLAPAERALSPFAHLQAMWDGVTSGRAHGAALAAAGAVTYACATTYLAAARCAGRGVPR